MTHPGIPTMYHTGIIVDDLDKAMTSYSAALGLTWAEPIPSSSLMKTREGMLPRLQWFTYSMEGDHRIELVEMIDNTAWATCSKPRLDHMGYWVDDFASEFQRLESLGFPSEISGADADGQPTGVSYHADPNNGLYIEIVDRSIEKSLATWWSGGAMTDGLLDRLKVLNLDEDSVREAFAHRHDHRQGHVHSHGNELGS